MLPLAEINLADGYRPGTLTVMVHSVPQSRQAHVSLVGGASRPVDAVGRLAAGAWVGVAGDRLDSHRGLGVGGRTGVGRSSRTATKSRTGPSTRRQRTINLIPGGLA
jgi:hypothetical protein